MTASPTDSLVVLRNGPAVPLAVVTWIIGAEERGLRFRVLSGGRLFAGPRATIRPEDEQFIRSHKSDLLACVRYCSDMKEAPQ